MPDYILIQDANHKWHRAKEQDLPDEATLQQLIRDNPEVLPLDDLGDQVPPLLIVGREAYLPNGYPDVIGVDQDGLVTILECKLDRNPEVKRAVIGQVLGYGAYLWGMSYAQFEAEIVRKYFDSQHCHRQDLKGIALDDAMELFRAERAMGDEWSKETFREQLEAKLKDGRFRLVIVVDKVNNELRRTVEYLNTCTGPNFDILCAELRYFATEHTRLLVPALIGRPSVSKAGTGKTSMLWTPEKFFPELLARSGAEAEQIARRLLEWCEQHCDEVYWGTGTRSGSFSAGVHWTVDRVATLFSAWTYGTIEMGFSYVKLYPPFDREEMRREWLTRVNHIQGAKLPEDSFNRRPTFRLTLLANEAEYQKFVETMQWVIDQLRAARDRKAA
jgi:hypothetical protein